MVDVVGLALSIWSIVYMKRVGKGNLRVVLDEFEKTLIAMATPSATITNLKNFFSSENFARVHIIAIIRNYMFPPPPEVIPAVRLVTSQGKNGMHRAREVDF